MATPGTIAQQKYQQELGGNQPIPGYPGVTLGTSTTVAQVDAYWSQWMQKALAADDLYSAQSFRQQWLSHIQAKPDFNAGNGFSGFSTQAMFNLYALKNYAPGTFTPYSAPLTVIAPAHVDAGLVQLTPSEKAAYDQAIATGVGVRPDGSVGLPMQLASSIPKPNGISGPLAPAPTQSALPGTPMTIGVASVTKGAAIEGGTIAATSLSENVTPGTGLRIPPVWALALAALGLLFLFGGKGGK